MLRTPCTGACMSCVAERQILLLSTTRLITVNICSDSKISHQYCPLTFHFRLDKEQLPCRQVDTAIYITTDLVNDECVVTDVSVLYSLRRFCLVHSLRPILVTMKGGSAVNEL